MNSLESGCGRLCVIVGGLTSLLSPATGHPLFVEGFDANGETLPGDHGPVNLIDGGWVFRNQSAPLGPFHWLDDLLGEPPQAGAGNLAASIWNVDGSGTISNWAILPDISALQPADLLTLWATNAGNNHDNLQIRFSPTGGTDTGSGAFDVGDFTQLLLEQPLFPSSEWSVLTVEVPGPGRLALRRFVDPGGLFTPNGGYLRLDSLTVGPPEEPPPPTKLTWFAEDNPHVISGVMVIEEDTIVTLEPGVVIEVQPQSTLQVEGTLIGHGSAALPIHISGGWSQVTPPVRVTGSLDVSFAQITGLIYGAGGSMVISDCELPQGEIGGSARVVRIDRCTFADGGSVHLTDSTLAVRDCTLQSAESGPAWLDASVSLLRGYLLIDNVAIDGGQVSFIRERSPQTAYINSISVIGNPEQSGLSLLGWDFLLGPDNLLLNNLYPLELGGGLDPDSTLPLTGNLNNYILGGPGAAGTLPDLGLPYVIDGFAFVGDMALLPGARLHFTPGSALIAQGDGDRRFLGLPEDPIVLQRFDPAQSWAGLLFQSTQGKVAHAVVEGADIGVIASDARVAVEDSILRNNGVGSNSNTFGLTVIRKTQLRDNNVGAQGSAAPVSNGEPDLFGLTNPNWIEGNGVGVQGLNLSDEIEARYNYWGDPSGPTAPQNPGGAGDAVEGFITFTPFLSSPPDFEDHPPVVRLTAPFFYAEPGDTSQLTWEVIENGVVVSQRVLFTPAFGHPFEVLAQNLPGDQRGLEFVVPAGNPGGGPNGAAVVRVEATDNAGQIGWDERRISVPNLEGIDSTYTFAGPFPEVVVPGDRVPVCWLDSGDTGLVEARLVLDADDRVISLGGTTTNCLSGDMLVPYVSTDTARVALAVSFSTVATQYFFSDYFSIRPDALIGDAAPAVQMLSPSAGQSFPGGTVLPITWSAADDEAVRSFDLQASFDGGRGWQFIARDLPPGTDSFDWQLPPSDGIDDVRVRVVVRDLRFQNSSDGSDRVIRITSGGGGALADLNGDGAVNAADLALLLGSWGPCTGCPADLDPDGAVDASDLALLLGDWT